MPEKSLFIRLLIAALVLLLLFGAYVFISAASGNSFKLAIQFSDHQCTASFGLIRATPDLASFPIGNIGESGFASNYNRDGTAGAAPDCVRLKLDANAAKKIDRDFRVCLTLADHAILDRSGAVKSVNEIGDKKCTPWASESGGWSAWASDRDKIDRDAGTISLETRALIAGLQIEDVQLGIQSSDYYGTGRARDGAYYDGCDGQIGAISYTPWLSEGGGWSSWNTDDNRSGPNCNRIYLSVVKSLTPLTTGGQCEERKTTQTILLASRGQDETYQSTSGIAGTSQFGIASGASVRLIPYKSWGLIHGAEWIGFAATNSTKRLGPADGAVVTFSKTVVLPAGAKGTGGLVSVLADNFVSLKVNGTSVAIPQDSAGFNFNTVQTVSLPVSVLKTGNNIFAFDVRQLNSGSAFGLSFKGQIFTEKITLPTDPTCKNVQEEEEEQEEELLPVGVCADNLDNDRDGFVDSADRGCQQSGGTTETDAVEPQNPLCSFTANKTTIIRGLDSAVLSWSCQGGTGNPSISNIGTVSLSGSTAVSPTQTTTYILTYSGKVLGSITIKVNAPKLEEQ